MLLRPPTPTLFPYTTLFRSSDLKGYFRAQTPFLGRWVAPVHEYHRLLAHGLVAVRVDHLITPPHHESIAGYAPANTPLIALPNTCPVAVRGCPWRPVFRGWARGLDISVKYSYNLSIQRF